MFDVAIRFGLIRQVVIMNEIVDLKMTTFSLISQGLDFPSILMVVGTVFHQMS